LVETPGTLEFVFPSAADESRSFRVVKVPIQMRTFVAAAAFVALEVSVAIGPIETSAVLVVVLELSKGNGVMMTPEFVLTGRVAVVVLVGVPKSEGSGGAEFVLAGGVEVVVVLVVPGVLKSKGSGGGPEFVIAGELVFATVELVVPEATLVVPKAGEFVVPTVGELVVIRDGELFVTTGDVMLPIGEGGKGIEEEFVGVVRVLVLEPPVTLVFEPVEMVVVFVGTGTVTVPDEPLEPVEPPVMDGTGGMREARLWFVPTFPPTFPTLAARAAPRTVLSAR
jgi:hypothetical protein